jgi:tetratricopeptide (TPR) repeat protein
MMGSCLQTQRRLLIGLVAIALLAGFTPWVEEALADAPVSSTAATTAAGSNPEKLSARIAKLIEQLGDPQYLVRQSAQEQLLRLGPDAFDALIAAETSEDVEIASRAKYLLQTIPIDRDFDSPQIKRILQGYTLADEAGRLAKVKQLVSLPQDAGIAALCRLVRYEKSPVLSKQTALILLSQFETSAEERASRAKLIDAALNGSSRPGAQWLLAEIRSEQDPEASISDWDRLIDEELATLASSPADTSSDIILTLQRKEVDGLLKLNHRDRALQVMRKMIAVNKGDAQSLEQLTEWLIKREAFDLVDETAKRYAGAFQSKPVLMYFLAETRGLRGQKDQAEKLAQQAAQLVSEGDFAERCRVAGKLRMRGLFEWSEREYKRVMDSKIDQAEAVFARVVCAEMLHDLDRDHDAAPMLQVLVDAMNRDKNVEQRVQQEGQIDPRLDPRTIRSTMHFYSACDFEKLKDRPQEWVQLEKSLSLDPTNADVMIAMYRADDGNETHSKRAKELVRKTAEQWRSQIPTLAGQPDEATMCNQYAWLVGNTEGDYDQAIQYSHKSIQLALQRYQNTDNDSDANPWGDSTEREPAGFIDTLAHCYAGKGDYENAVKYQMRAAELEPHTMTIVRAVDEFKAKLNASRKQKE